MSVKYFYLYLLPASGDFQLKGYFRRVSPFCPVSLLTCFPPQCYITVCIVLVLLPLVLSGKESSPCLILSPCEHCHVPSWGWLVLHSGWVTCFGGLCFTSSHWDLHLWASFFSISHTPVWPWLPFGSLFHLFRSYRYLLVSVEMKCTFVLFVIIDVWLNFWEA